MVAAKESAAIYWSRCELSAGDRTHDSKSHQSELVHFFRQAALCLLVYVHALLKKTCISLHLAWPHDNEKIRAITIDLLFTKTRAVVMTYCIITFKKEC